MKSAIFFLFLLFSFMAHAQVKIVKDNVACLYGIKHESGEWILKPEYTFITAIGEYKSHYKLLKNGKFQLADRNGAIITDTTYNHLEEISGTGNYFVSQGKYRGIIDEYGKEILAPKKYSYIYQRNHNIYKCVYKKTSDYLINGRIFSGKILNEVSVIQVQNQNYFVLQKNSKNGNISTLVKSTPGFDTLLSGRSIQIHNTFDRFIITYADSTLIYDPKFKLIHHLPFPRISHEDLIYGIFKTDSNFRFKKNKKVGIANFRGEILVKPIYESIYEFMPHNSSLAYSIIENGKIGFLAKDYTVSVKPEFDRSDLRVLKNHLLLSKEGHYNLFDLKGELLIASKLSYFNDNSTRNFLRDSSNIYFLNQQYDPFKSTIEAPPYFIEEFILKAGQFYIYKFGNQYIPFTMYKESLLIQSNSHAHFRDSIYVVSHYGVEYKYKPDGTLMEPEPKKITYNIIHSINRQYAIYKSNTFFGILDQVAYTPYLEAKYQMIIPATDNLVWIKNGDDPNCRFLNVEAGNWKLCHLDGSVAVDLNFDLPTRVNGLPAIVYTNNKCGVYDFNTKTYVVEPKYHYMSETSSLFPYLFLFNEKQEFLVLNQRRELISDKLWKFAIKTKNSSQSPQLFNILNPDNATFHKTRSSDYIIFINDTDSMAVSSNGEILSNSNEIERIIQDGFFITEHDATYNQDRTGGLQCTYRQFESFRTALDEAIIKLKKAGVVNQRIVPHSEMIHVDMETTENGYKKLLSINTGHNSSSNYFSGKVTYCDEDYVSIIDKISYNNTFIPYNFRREYGYLFQFELKNIFLPDVNVEDAMIILLTEAIHGRDDLFLDCHNPSTIFDRTGKNFFFDQSGLHFSLLDEHQARREIVVGWQKLKKYAPEKGIVADFLSNEIK